MHAGSGLYDIQVANHYGIKVDIVSDATHLRLLRTIKSR
jgi:hypothetical protein